MADHPIPHPRDDATLGDVSQPPIVPGPDPNQPQWQPPQQPYYPPPRQGDIVGKTAMATTTVIAIIVAICVLVPALLCGALVACGAVGNSIGH